MALPFAYDAAPELRPARDRSSVPNMGVVAGRRRYTWIAVSATMLLMLLMVGAVLVHTTVAERQLRIDAIEREVRDQADDFEVLRAERAELRSPARLASAADKLGMVPAVENSYATVDPVLYARMIAQSGIVPDGTSGNDLGLAVDMDPLEQYELVKSVGADLP